MDDLDSVKQRILTRVPLAELVGESVSLTVKSGKPMGKCPFHEDSSPSFVIYDDRYHCFGCKANGDAIEFVRKTKGLEFFDALRFLAEKYGVEAPELERTAAHLRSTRKTSNLFGMMRDAQEFYQTELFTSRGEAARSYLLERGFSPENIKKFGFGVTPEEGFGLVKFLRTKGHREEDMIACSLASRSTKTGRAFDFQRSRITIPIHDAQGRVIAFGGRTLIGDDRKYMNSRDTDLFDKSKTLFGLHVARDDIRRKLRVIVVEGYMDALQLWQQGFPETVACLGTALTESHLKSLRNLTSEVILLFDGDSAGQKATLGAVSTSLAVPQLAVKAAVLPPKEDPDSFTRKRGGEALSVILSESQELLDFAIASRLKTTHALGVPDLVLKEFVPWLAKVQDRVTRSFLMGRIADKTAIPADQIAASLAPMPFEKTKQRVEPAEPRFVTPYPTGAVYEILGHIFHAEPTDLNAEKFRGAARDAIDWHPAHFQLLSDLLETLAGGDAPSRSFPAGDADPTLSDFLGDIRVRGPAFRCGDRSEALGRLFQHLSIEKLKNTIKSTNNKLRQVMAMPDSRSEQTALLAEIQQCNQRIKDLERSRPESFQ